MKYSCFFLLSLMILGCSKRPSYDTKIIGHGGNGLQNHQTFAHDNSLKSIEIALATDGCDGVEIDIQVSKDKTLWLYHDTELESATDGVGTVHNSTDEYLEGLRYNSPGKEPLIRLDEIPKDWMTGKIISLDMKDYFSISYDEYVQLTDSLYGNFVNSTPNALIEIISYDRTILSEMNYPGVTRYIILSQNELESLSATELEGFEGVMTSNEFMSKEYVDFIHGKGKLSAVWGIRAPKTTREAMEKGVDLLITDDIAGAVIEKN